jgi:hypothetical protein
MLRSDECCKPANLSHFPLAAVKGVEQTRRVLADAMDWLWPSSRIARLRNLLATENNVIDIPQNMIALEPLLHYWWSQGRLGFEPLGKIEKDIQVRFRWLKKSSLSMMSATPLDTDPRTLQFGHPTVDGILSISDFRTHRPIEDGQVITIVANDESEVPNLDILQLQWDLLRISSLSGAAEPPDDDEESQDYDSESVGDYG